MILCVYRLSTLLISHSCPAVTVVVVVRSRSVDYEQSATKDINTVGISQCYVYITEVKVFNIYIMYVRDLEENDFEVGIKVTCCLRNILSNIFHFIQVLIVGNGGVGKSSLIQRYCKGGFTADYKKTIGVDFLEKRIW